MKRLFVLAAFLSMSVASHALDFPVHEKVYDLPNLSKAQVYSGTRMWLAENYRAEVIQLDDKDAGTIVSNISTGYKCKGLEDCFLNSKAYIKFTLKVDTKDTKLRTTYTNVNIYDPKSSTLPLNAKQIANIEMQLNEFSTKLVEKVKTNQTSNSNW